VAVWDVGTGERFRSFAGHAKWVASVAFSPDGRLVASGSRDRTVKVWDPHTGRVLRVLEGLSSGVESVAFGPDGRLVASGTGDGVVSFWALGSDQRIRRPSGHDARIVDVLFGLDGQSIVSASEDGTMVTRDLRSGEAIGRPSNVRSDRRRVAFIRARTYASKELIDMRTGERIPRSHNRQVLLAGSKYRSDGAPYNIWLLNDGRLEVRDFDIDDRVDGLPLELASIALDGGLSHATWQPYGRLLIVGSMLGDLYCFEYRDPPSERRENTLPTNRWRELVRSLHSALRRWCGWRS
jgi:hypothetical protein